MSERFISEAVVYVIDDDTSVRDGLKSLFESVGLRAELFASVRDFLEWPTAEIPHCLVLDVRLPGLSGLEFHKELVRANQQIPVIFITGHGDIPMSVSAMKSGAVEFLTKPFRDQDLLDAVLVALDHDRTRRQEEVTLNQLVARFQKLSAREREVVKLVVAGRLNKQIAAELGLSEVTIKLHRANAQRKLGAKSLVELVRIADRLSKLNLSVVPLSTFV